MNKALKLKGFDLPIKSEWKTFEDVSYLKLQFRSAKSASDLILKGLKVGPSEDRMIYPLIIFPYLKDKTVIGMMTHHEVQIESTGFTNKMTILQCFSQYEILDIIEISSNKFIVIFVKQPVARQILNSEKMVFGNVIWKFSTPETIIHITRKSFKEHFLNELEILQLAQQNALLLQANQMNRNKLTLSSSNQPAIRHELIPPPSNFEGSKSQQHYNDHDSNKNYEERKDGYKKNYNNNSHYRSNYRDNRQQYQRDQRGGRDDYERNERRNNYNDNYHNKGDYQQRYYNNSSHNNRDNRNRSNQDRHYGNNY